MWIFAEALYLHILISVAVFSENSSVKWYVLLGWGELFVQAERNICLFIFTFKLVTSSNILTSQDLVTSYHQVGISTWCKKKSPHDMRKPKMEWEIFIWYEKFESWWEKSPHDEKKSAQYGRNLQMVWEISTWCYKFPYDVSNLPLVWEISAWCEKSKYDIRNFHMICEIPTL